MRGFRHWRKPCTASRWRWINDRYGERSVTPILLLASNISTNFHRISEETDFNAVNSPYNFIETGRERPSSRFPQLANRRGPASPEAEPIRHGAEGTAVGVVLNAPGVGAVGDEGLV